jgi:hypothetical protein
MNDSPNLPTGPASPLYLSDVVELKVRIASLQKPLHLKLTRTELLNKATNPKRARHRG